MTDEAGDPRESPEGARRRRLRGASPSVGRHLGLDLLGQDLAAYDSARRMAARAAEVQSVHRAILGSGLDQAIANAKMASHILEAFRIDGLGKYSGLRLAKDLPALFDSELIKAVKELKSSQVFRDIEEMQARNSAWIARLQERMAREVTEEERQLLEFRGARGWYISPHEPWDQSELLDMLAAGQTEALEDALADIARSRVDAIATTVAARSPHRAALIQEAVEAHKRGMYGASVSLFISQAEGLGLEIIGESVFSVEDAKGGKGKRPKTQRVVLQRHGDASGQWRARRSNSHLALLVEVTSFAEATDIRDARRAQDPDHGPLNRHAVLHGLDTDYATEYNSLRAIMFLDYLCWVAKDLEPETDSAA